MRQLEKTLNTATYIVKVQNNCAWTQRRKRWGRDACVKKIVNHFTMLNSSLQENPQGN